jgi:hypothetical protein
MVGEEGIVINCRGIVIHGGGGGECEQLRVCNETKIDQQGQLLYVSLSLLFSLLLCSLLLLSLSSLKLSLLF